MQASSDKLKKMNGLRGLLALEIVIGHSIRYSGGILFPFGKFMICGVALFFFVSAWGLVLSYSSKPNYLDMHYFLSKPVYLFLVAVSIYAISVAIDFVLPQDLGFVASLGSLYGFFVYTNWYIWYQILFYLLFWFTYRYLYRWRVAIIAIVTVVLVIAAYAMGWADSWMLTQFAFPAGIVFAENYERASEFVASWRGKALIVVLVGFGLGALFLPMEGFVATVLMRNSICLGAVMIMLYICEIGWLINNPVSRFLKKYSLEIYVSQFVWLFYIENINPGYWTRVGIMLAGTGLTAFVVHWPIVVIRRLVKKL